MEKKDGDIGVPRWLGISEGRLDNPIACEPRARDAAVKILADGAVAAGREDGGGRRTDEDADLTVGEEPVCSIIGQVRDETWDFDKTRVRIDEDVRSDEKVFERG